MSEKIPQSKINFKTMDVLKLITENPSKVPITLQSATQGVEIKEPDLLFPKNMKIANLNKRIKNQTNFEESIGLTLFCGNKLLPPDKTVNEVYEEFKSQDSILRIWVKQVESFGF